MKNNIVKAGIPAGVLVLFLAFAMASCASSRSSGGAEGGAASQAGASGLIPVETKASVLFADGSLDEYMTSEYDDSLSNLQNQIRFSASGAQLEQIEYSYDAENGRLAQRLTKDVENKIKNKVTYEYNDQGYLWRETITNRTDKPVSSYEYAYDSRGNRTSRIVKSGSGLTMAETVYTYDGKGLETSSETRSGSGQKISSTENQYNNTGGLINQKVLNADGQLSAGVSITWQNGLETEREEKGAAGDTQMRISNEYGANGELLKRTIHNLLWDSKQVFEYEYAFKPAGR